MCWHNNHKANYRDRTGNVKNTPNNELQTKTHRIDNKKIISGLLVKVIILSKVTGY
jgi:hypothetical protein